MEHIVYKTNTASLFQIEEHLNLCSDNFIEKLSERINIKEYSIKIKENAVTFEAWYNEQLVGLIACYANNIDSGIAFITNVSVLKDFQSKGIAHNLLKNLQSDELIKKFRIVQLLVDVDNYSAISLYKKNGFFLDRKHGNQSFMTYYTNPKNPLVSICCVTYNHEPYIHDCLNGFIMQKTNFPFEVLIHDDASTDKTADIIREYEAKYPNIIKPVYQSENQFSKKVGINITYQFPRAKGKYIALCEGDDYWTDPLKLQKQVDFLESSPNFSAVAHNSKIKYPNQIISNIKTKNEYTIFDFLESSCVNTATLMFRNINNYPSWFFEVPFGDWALYILLAENGRFGFMQDEMSVYRIHNQGVWSGLQIKEQQIKTIGFLNIIKDNYPKYEARLEEIIDNKMKYHGLYDYSLKSFINGKISLSVFIYGIRVKLNLKNRIKKIFQSEAK